MNRTNKCNTTTFKYAATHGQSNTVSNARSNPKDKSGRKWTIWKWWDAMIVNISAMFETEEEQARVVVGLSSIQSHTSQQLIDKLSYENSALRAENWTMNERINALKQNYITQQEHINWTREQRTNADALIETLQQKIQAHSQVVASYKKQITQRTYNYQYELDKLKKTNALLQQQIARVPASLPKLIYDVKKCLTLSINTETYYDYESRIGCNTDRNNIRSTFGDQYRYDIIENEGKIVTKKQFDDLLYRTRERLYKNEFEYDAFIGIFGGHGDEHSIMVTGEKFGYQSVSVQIGKIVESLSGGTCGLGSSFSGKPKIFIFQSCRGSRIASGLAPNINMNVKYDTTSSTQQRIYHPDSDVIIIRPTTATYKAGRDHVHGSYLIQSLCETFKAFRECQRFALSDLLIQMRKKLTDISNNNSRLQIMCVSMNTLTTNVHFVR